MSDQLLATIAGQLADIAKRISAPRVAVFDAQGNPVGSIAGASAAASTNAKADLKAAVNAGRALGWVESARFMIAAGLPAEKVNAVLGRALDADPSLDAAAKQLIGTIEAFLKQTLGESSSRGSNGRGPHEGRPAAGSLNPRVRASEIVKVS